MKKYFSLFVSVVIIGVSFHSSFAQNQVCTIPPDSRTIIVVHSKEEASQTIKDYLETHHTTSSGSSVNVSVGATIPILDVPSPFNFGGGSSDTQTVTDQVVQKYESESRQSGSQDIYLSFIPTQILDAYKDCTISISKPIDINVNPTVNGKSITIDLFLKQNSAETEITDASMRIGNETYNFSKLKNDRIFKAPLKINDRAHYSINVTAPKKTSEFFLYIATDRYTPINIYYQHLNPPKDPLTKLQSKRPTITFQCYNPMITIGHTSNRITDRNLSGRAVSEAVQFDVNIEPPSRVIRVAPNNNGECVATIPQNENFIFTASAIYKSPNGAYPLDIENSMEITSSATLGNKKEVHFVVKVNNTSAAGSVTLFFTVEYAHQ